MSSVYNPTLQDFVNMSAEDRAVLTEVLAKCAEIIEPAPLEEFNKWLDRMAKAKYVTVLPEGERNARKIHAARVAEFAGTPLVHRRPTLAAATEAARPRTTAEYLEQTGESRPAAESRIRERMGKPGAARNWEDVKR